MKQIYRYLGIVFVIISLYFFIDFFIKNISSLPPLDWSINSLYFWFVAIILYICNTLAGGLVWYLLLKSTGEFLKLRETLLIFSISQFAKYIPGNVAQHVGRVALAKTHKVSIPKVLITMVLETVFLVIVGVVISIISLALIPSEYFSSVIPSIPPLWQFLLIAIAIIFLPLGTIGLLNKWRPKFLDKMLGNEKLIVPKTKYLVGIFGLYFIGFIFMGFLSVIVVYGIFDISGNYFLILMGIYTLSWLAGYLMPGAPAGMGIRELILVSVLTTIFGPGIALGITIVLRFVSIIGDVIIFVVALIVKRIIKKDSQSDRTLQKQ